MMGLGRVASLWARTLLLGAALMTAGCSLPHAVGTASWSVPLAREHPLVGSLWKIETSTQVTFSDFVSQLVAADYVLLGEQHDNPDHHRFQARVIGEMARRGRRAAVAFEMLDEGDIDALVSWQREQSWDADRLAAAVAWDESGWPAWDLYRPVFRAAAAARLPFAAAGVSRARVWEQAAGARDLPESTPGGLLDEIRAAHCGHAPEDALPAMVRAQMLRDETMARVVMRAGVARGAVLIAGNGHARSDRGVPVLIRSARPDASVVSVGLVEVIDGLDAPHEYAEPFFADSLPFDYVWFTPRVDDEDPCAKFRASLDRLKKRSKKRDQPSP